MQLIIESSKYYDRVVVLSMSGYRIQILKNVPVKDIHLFLKKLGWIYVTRVSKGRKSANRIMRVYKK